MKQNTRESVQFFPELTRPSFGAWDPALPSPWEENPSFGLDRMCRKAAGSMRKHENNHCDYDVKMEGDMSLFFAASFVFAQAFSAQARKALCSCCMMVVCSWE